MAALECSGRCLKAWLKSNVLLLLTLLGVVIGFVIAILVKPLDPSYNAIMWINFPGELFMRALKCCILPIIVSSVITAVASLDLKTNSKMGGFAFAYMIISIVLAVLLGLILSLAIQPGKSFNEATDESETREVAYYETQDVFADLFRNLITDNIVKACIQTAYTDYDLNTTTIFDTNINETLEQIEVLSKSVGYGGGTNYLGVLLFSMVFGMAMTVEREQTAVMLKFFVAMRVIIFKIITVLLWLLPIATISLIAGSILRVDDVVGVLISLGLFSATVIAGLAIHTFITIPLIYVAFTRKNPFKPVLVGSFRPGLFVVIVRSSIASMVEIMNACQRIGMNQRVYDFVIPLSISFKKDGSALFIVCSSLWLAQTEGYSLSAGNIVSIAIMASALAMSLPGIPSTSLVAIATIAGTAGISVENIGVLFAMEWLLDALRGGVNGISYVVNAGVVDDKMAGQFRDALTTTKTDDVKNNEWGEDNNIIVMDPIDDKAAQF
ncbi:excitatory amino acid transporter 1-like [Ptychodera flava]|uniref:excitatory amino acid transporter 1-like n=1 Tax=Ptychodera flava TaxID=63121 RepID=UPI003969EA16